MPLELAFEAEIWQHDGAGGWHFVTVPLAVADEIRERAPAGRGFGSRRVTASLRGSTWSTSVFPDSTSGSFLLPIKQQVRRAAEVEAGDMVRVVLHVEVPHDAGVGSP
jgi:Domain of unknown function (DUF1905)